MYAFFDLKKWWLEPGIALSYGWGSKTEFERKLVDIAMQQLKTSRKKTIIIQHDEAVRDFSTLFSFRHTFSVNDVQLKRSQLSVRPIILLSAATENVGFNTTFNSPFYKIDYSLGRYYVLPQVMLDYYLHTADKRFNSALSLTAGVNF